MDRRVGELKRRIEDLTHHPLNSEIYSLTGLDDLMTSLEKFGLLQPIVINHKDQVISGHRRLEAAKRLSWDEIEVELIDPAEVDEPLLLVHYNKQRVKTCREILREVSILTPTYAVGSGTRTDLTSVPENTGRARDKIANSLGVSSSQIGKLLFIDKTDPQYIDWIDEGKMTVSQAYLTLSRMKKQNDGVKVQNLSGGTVADGFVFHNKSSQTMLELSDKSIDLIFTSPPYWNKRVYIEQGGLGNETNDHEYVSNLLDHLKECSRVIKETGSFFLVLGDTYKDGNLLNIPHRIAIGLQDQGWLLRNTIIWKKNEPQTHFFEVKPHSNL